MTWFVFIVLIAGVVWFIGNNPTDFPFRNQIETPIDILKRRFANGEITEEEYDRKRAIFEEDEYIDYKP